MRLAPSKRVVRGDHEARSIEADSHRAAVLGRRWRASRGAVGATDGSVSGNAAF
ncbi:hypothetical protein A7982_12684 [Minicystis rosea]|nr:hypothetical protein A7982_12684 [Minicystis rosea]